MGYRASYGVENSVLFSNDTAKLGIRNSDCSYQESNLHVRPFDYKFRCSTIVHRTNILHTARIGMSLCGIYAHM